MYLLQRYFHWGLSSLVPVFIEHWSAPCWSWWARILSNRLFCIESCKWKVPQPVINLYSETSNLPVCQTVNDWLHFLKKKKESYLVTKPTFFPLFILFIIQRSWMLLELGQWLLSERFWNCQYNSFKNWQSLKETVQIELIFNPILFYQNIMFNLSWSVVFGAIENLKYIRRGLKF